MPGHGLAMGMSSLASSSPTVMAASTFEASQLSLISGRALSSPPQSPLSVSPAAVFEELALTAEAAQEPGERASAKWA
jgi:hypothetical protein